MRPLLLVLALLLAGCQSAPARPRVAEPGAPNALSFGFLDARSHVQVHTVQDRDSLGTTTVLGEDAYPRPPEALVRAWLQDRSGLELAGRQVVLDEFSATVFEPAPGNSSLAGRPAPVPEVAGTKLSTIAANAIAKSILETIARRSTLTLVSARVEVTIDGTKVVGMSRESLKGSITTDDIYQVIFQALEDLSADAKRQ